MNGPSDHRVISLVFAVTFTSILGNTLLAPVIPDILEDFGRPDSAGGLLISVSTLPGVLVAPIAGLLADRWGRREVLVPCLALFGGCGLAATLAPTFGVLLVCRFGMGIGAAALINLAVVLIGDRFDGVERTRWIGRNAGVLTIGLAAAPLIAGALELIGGWRLALTPYGFGLVAATYAWFTLDRSSARSVSPLGSQVRQAGSVLRRPLLLVNFAAAALGFAIIFGVFLGSVPTLLDNEFRLDAFWRGVVLAAPALSSSVVAFNLGRIHRAVSRSVLLIICGLAWVIAFTIMGLTPWLSLFVAGAMLYGPGEGGMIPSLQNAALDRAPLEHRAVVLAVWTASARLGQTIGPLAASALLVFGGGRVPILAGGGGSMILVGLFFLVYLRTRHHRDRPIPQPD